jgi:hypothetical protein
VFAAFQRGLHQAMGGHAAMAAAAVARMVAALVISPVVFMTNPNSTAPPASQQDFSSLLDTLFRRSYILKKNSEYRSQESEERQSDSF